ncbi:MAG: hypothetical protein KKD38_02745 [Candidatus Delongbacteria bacterium]|nr:hypothetical protein [Candidatus Delongbacteria bacterium]MCG2760118.1 hypothetical protein [Candidatus Delongbacteria bacterium]
MLKYFLLLLIISSNLIYSYPFTVPYFNEEFFLYPFLNYDQSVEWKRVREGKLYDGSLIQMSYGSLTTYSLMNSEEVVINKEMDEDFSFRLRYRNHETRHLSYIENSISTGLVYKVNEYFKIMCEAELPYEKASIDIKPGVLFSFQSVYAYFGVNFNDILFDMKDPGEGKNNTMPLTFTTDIRFSFNRLYFFISGNYSTGIDRTWPVSSYTDVLENKNHIRNLYARIEYDLTDYLKIYSENYWDDFYDEKEYKFSATLRENKLGGIWSLNSANILDLGLGIANTAHDFDVIKGKTKSYTINYTALLPWLLYNYKIDEKLTIQSGYMASYTIGESDDNHYYLMNKNYYYWDKELIKLGLEYRFSPNSSLYISAGQLINTGTFGGGNARFNLFF